MAQLQNCLRSILYIKLNTSLFLMKRSTDTDVGYNISILIYIEVLLNYAKACAVAYEPYAVNYHKFIGYRIILKQYVYCVMFMTSMVAKLKLAQLHNSNNNCSGILAKTMFAMVMFERVQSQV